MIVYGDPSTQESFRTLVERLKESLSAARQGSLDDARSVLIQAGMLEQAVEDALPEWGPPCHNLTAALAEAFLRHREPLPEPSERGALAALAHVPDVPLTVKMPEGFAFYGLYPEAYAVAADRWRADHPGARVAVIGIRSIGTTLSAVVLAALRARRTWTYRLTLRPTGHPFAREATLPPLKATHALIVDEGPGLSGSSMAAVAEAVQAAGIPRDRIAFLPGHGNDPGGMASDIVRRWWRETPRYLVPTEELRWIGRTLEETLLHETESGVGIEDLTGGRWRARVYVDEADWPAVAFPFERRKLLVTRADGSRVLYKFVGLTEPGMVLGFAPTPWIDGTPLTLADASPELLTQIGHHIATFAGPPLLTHEADAARERLIHMLHHNTEEAGITNAERVAVGSVPTRSLANQPESSGQRAGASAGDYRLAPHEWRRLPDGAVVKTNCRAATGDHTIVGTQPVAWDIAGAMVEWNLNETTATPLLSALAGRGIHTTEVERRFYSATYAAFQMGLHAHCASQVSGAECVRLETAALRYRDALGRAIGAEGT